MRLLFSAGQLLRCVVAELGEEKDAAGIQRKKVELTLAQVNAGLSIEDLTVGMVRMVLGRFRSMKVLNDLSFRTR